jgi:D-glycero-D-manno-heptose 1,7-bisphosphate phosphatase
MIRAAFLDRDGVINADHGYVHRIDDFHFLPGVVAALRRLAGAGFLPVIVTNQSGIARGLYDEAGFRALMGWVADRVRAAGGTLDDVRYCPHHPSITGPCACRKPGPGMLLDLIARWELDPARTVFVGDSESDMQAAAAAGVRGERVTGGPLALFVRARLLRDADPGRP